MRHFADRLCAAVTSKQTPICLGLDPHWPLIEETFGRQVSIEKTIEIFLCKILDSCHDLVCSCKPNFAFFEEFGWEGVRAFERVCEHAKKLNLQVIVDAKRNDIGSTAAASARAFLARDLFDALTVNPLLGEDGILPFSKLARENGKGIFILVKTSNPSAGDFQDLVCDGEFLHEKVAQRVALWGADDLSRQNFSSVGAVVGATWPEELRGLRQTMGAQIFLIPGFGAQGGKASDIFPAFFENGLGAIVNSSRGILFAPGKGDFQENARQAAKRSGEQFAPVFGN